MKRITVGIVVGIIAGSAATYLLVQKSGIGPYKPIFSQPRSSQDVPKMSIDAAEKHRKGAYADIHSIEEILALPTDFSQTEALYVLAGRSDSPAVQELIYQANQIANPTDRRGALQVLFSRLTVLDPQSALALSQTRDYASNSQLEAMIWGEWSKNDFDNALIAAADLQSDARRNNAAQGMYAAYGYAGSDEVSTIEDALGVSINRNTKAQFLYSLAARSPAEAVAFINGQTMPRDQQMLTYWLASHLGQGDPESARQYAKLFANKQFGDYFLRSLTSASAEINPQVILDNVLAEGATEQSSRHAVSALQQLALKDPDKAIAYMERARSSQERQTFATIIAISMAETDPDRAIQWALEIDDGSTQQVYANILSSIARNDPVRALDAASHLQNKIKRNQALHRVLTTIANTDPQMAASYLDQVENKDVERRAAARIAMYWTRKDPDAALEWVLSRNVQERRQLLSQVGSTLAAYDTQAAIRLLPRLDDQSAADLRVQIVSQMASHGQTVEAQAFISQYEGHREHSQMFAALVRSTAASDFQSALQMARSLPDGSAKDGVMSELAQQRLNVDPAEAMRMLPLISDENQRLNTTLHLAQYWQRQDAEGAASWARNLRSGAQRDTAITGLASGWDDVTPSRKLLLNSIGDLEKRRQAQIATVRRVARSDHDAAERLVAEFNLPDEYSQQLETMLEQQRSERVSIGSN